MGDNQKPYYSKDQVESIVSVFKKTMAEDKKDIDDQMLDGLRKYISSRKTVYENACLDGVLAGNYLISERENRAAYKIVKPEGKGVNDKKLMRDRADLLNHAIQAISMYGKKNSGLLVGV